MEEILKVASGVCWIVTYVLVIRRASRDEVYGVPMVAAAANLAWEFIFSFVRPMEPPQLYINWLWLGLDIVIVYQCLRYGRREWADGFSAVGFWAGFASVVVMASTLVWLVAAEFAIGGRYAAFGQNLMMSALFIAMLLRRGSTRGQSIGIAAFKLLGTGFASLYCVLTARRSPLLDALFLFTFVLDFVYLAMLHKLLGEGDGTAELISGPPS